MKIKQTILGLAFIIGFCVMLVSPATYAATCGEGSVELKSGQSCCGGVVTSIISCEQKGVGSSLENSGIWGILLLVINILTAGIGVAAVGGLVYAGILYTSAGDSPDGVKKAKTIMINITIGLVTYALMYAGLNFIIPGGLFSL